MYNITIQCVLAQRLTMKPDYGLIQLISENWFLQLAQERLERYRSDSDIPELLKVDHLSVVQTLLDLAQDGRVGCPPENAF